MDCFILQMIKVYNLNIEALEKNEMKNNNCRVYSVIMQNCLCALSILQVV